MPAAEASTTCAAAGRIRAAVLGAERVSRMEIARRSIVRESFNSLWVETCVWFLQPCLRAMVSRRVTLWTNRDQRANFEIPTWFWDGHQCFFGPLLCGLDKLVCSGVVSSLWMLMSRYGKSGEAQSQPWNGSRSPTMVHNERGWRLKCI